METHKNEEENEQRAEEHIKCFTGVKGSCIN